MQPDIDMCDRMAKRLHPTLEEAIEKQASGLVWGSLSAVAKAKMQIEDEAEEYAEGKEEREQAALALATTQSESAAARSEALAEAEEQADVPERTSPVEPPPTPMDAEMGALAQPPQPSQAHERQPQVALAPTQGFVPAPRFQAQAPQGGDAGARGRGRGAMERARGETPHIGGAAAGDR